MSQQFRPHSGKDTNPENGTDPSSDTMVGATRWHRRLSLASLVLTGCILAGPALANSANQVVVSIKPIHSLVSAVMAGVGEPHLLIRGSGSPHNFNLRPSDAAVLQEARVVFLVGKSLETSLADPVDTLATNARVVVLSETEGLKLLPIREGGAFEGHDHDHDHGHEADHDDDHDDPHHDDHDDDHDDPHHDEADHDHDHDDAHRDDDDHDDHDDDHHGHGHDEHSEEVIDQHIWLDPENAVVMAGVIADTLAASDPDNAAIYAANGQSLSRRLDALTSEIDVTLAPARGESFIVFHDAYQYFEERFGLTAVGSATVSPERSPGARRIRELREKVRNLGVTCVFAEPQFDSRVVEVIAEDTPARTGVLDPLGATIDRGADAYFTLLRNMAGSFRNCLAPTS